MAENTKIEWATHTFNPWVGCTKISPACDNCYAEMWAKRSGMVEWGPKADRRRTTENNWRTPVKWNSEAQRLGVRYRVFCASLADVFDNAAPQEWRDDLFTLIKKTPHLDWLLLTKRIGNAANMLPVPFDFDRHYPNVWLGITICNQEEADRDIPKLLGTRATKRFLSVEPLLGPVDLETLHNTDLGEGQPYLHPLIGRVSDGQGDSCDAPSIDWVIVGGESGPGARPMHPDWVIKLRDQCQITGVAFMFKQWGEWAPAEAISDDVSRKLAEVWIRKDGSVIEGGEVDFFDDDAVLYRAGKKDAGRQLDGQIWDETPVS